MDDVDKQEHESYGMMSNQKMMETPSVEVPLLEE